MILFFVPLPLIEAVALQAIEFWRQSKAEYFDGANFVANLQISDVQELIEVCWTAFGLICLGLQRVIYC